MKKDDDKIVIVPKGVRSVEHYVMARRLMHHNVYYHKITRVAIYLLQTLLEKLLEKDKFENINNSDLLEFFSLVSKNKEKSDFKKTIIKDGFRYYSTITDNDMLMMIKELSKGTAVIVSLLRCPRHYSSPFFH
jgi:HD superfamily phosphohydrolase